MFIVTNSLLYYGRSMDLKRYARKIKGFGRFCRIVLHAYKHSIRRESNEVQRDNRTVQTNRAVSGQSRTTSPQASSTKSVNAVICRKCKSQQIVANKRGYSFANMFKTLGWMGLFPLILVLVGFIGTYLLTRYVRVGSGGGFEGILLIIGIICWISISFSLPVSILVGFAGRSEIVNGCMNCGFKWRPANRK